MVGAANIAPEEYLSVFDKGSPNYSKLSDAAFLISYRGGFRDAVIIVSETYFDYGQSWKYTTILLRTPDGAIQILTPRQQMLLIFGDQSERDGVISEIIDNISSILYAGASN